jgi:GntR family transcriptional regulator/MocR family aminotransferase
MSLDYLHAPVLFIQIVQMLPYQTLLKIDAEDKKALYEQIAVSLSKCIKDGTIPPGTKLPSSRTLADTLNLHRKTILAAYDELINQGWIIAKNRSGYYINPDIAIADTVSKSKKDNRFPDKSPVPLIAAFPVVRTNGTKSVKDVNTVFIDDGLPDARLAPYSSLLRELKIVTERNYKLKKVNYGTTIESQQEI